MDLPSTLLLAIKMKLDEMYPSSYKTLDGWPELPWLEFHLGNGLPTTRWIYVKISCAGGNEIKLLLDYRTKSILGATGARAEYNLNVANPDFFEKIDSTIFDWLSEYEFEPHLTSHRRRREKAQGTLCVRTGC